MAAPTKGATFQAGINTEIRGATSMRGACHAAPGKASHALAWGAHIGVRGDRARCRRGRPAQAVRRRPPSCRRRGNGCRRRNQAAPRR
jgi:hypothetical protein